MSDQTETSSSKRHPVADPNVTPGGETKSDPVQSTTPTAPVPLPEPDPALPSCDQEIVE
jgi:hypothetical protein